MIRRATDADVPAMLRVQQASPEAAQWPPGSDPALVAEVDGVICGFVTWLDLGSGEAEILNLAVDPSYRRQGLAKQLVLGLTQSSLHTIFLEVRSSNAAARQLYQVIGFTEVSIRPQYYSDTLESAVVMKWSS